MAQNYRSRVCCEIQRGGKTVSRSRFGRCWKLWERGTGISKCHFFSIVQAIYMLLLVNFHQYSAMVSPLRFALKSHLPCIVSILLYPDNTTYICNVSHISECEWYDTNEYKGCPYCLWCPSEMFMSMNPHIYIVSDSISKGRKSSRRTAVLGNGRIGMEGCIH